MVELLIAFLTLPIVGVAALYDWFFNDPSRKTKFKKWEMKTKGERTTLSLDARHSQIESGMRALAKNLHRKMETKRLLICYKAGTKTKYRKETVVAYYIYSFFRESQFSLLHLFSRMITYRWCIISSIPIL